MDDPIQIARPLPVPYDRDTVAGPVVHYEEGLAEIRFLTRDERWARVTFEDLDALRVSRGEHEPYPIVDEGDASIWVTTVENSAWLRERYAYEKRYYGDAYGFGGDVGEMQRAFSHYVFHFHDAFVEALAAGIWFDTEDASVEHPLRPLEDFAPVEPFAVGDMAGRLCRNPLSPEVLEAQARLCSQTLFVVQVPGIPRLRVTYRVRDGVGRSWVRDVLGNVLATREGVMDMEALRGEIVRLRG